MRRPLAAVAVLLCCLATACGTKSPAESEQRSEVEYQCPPEIEEVAAADVIGRPPRGFEVARPADPQLIENGIRSYTDALGEHLRSTNSRVLVRKRRENGTAVVVINADQQIGIGDDLIVGVEEGARERGLEPEQIEVAGTDGRLLQAPDGAWYSISGYGQCAMLLLIADYERFVRRTAEQLPPGPRG